MGGWAPGDLALCVRGGEPRLSVARNSNGQFYREGPCNDVLRKGALYTVTKVGLAVGAEQLCGLALKESPRPWISSRFIKVTPPEATEEDAETIRLLTDAPVPALAGSGG